MRLAYCFLIVAGSCSLLATATAEPPKSAQSSDAAPPSTPGGDVIAEILAIRAATGGSESSGDEAEFAAALKQVMGVAEEVSTPAAEHDAVTPLRQSARHFDSLAADYEDAGDYEEADQAREVAHTLRLEARRLTGRP